MQLQGRQKRVSGGAYKTIVLLTVAVTLLTGLGVRLAHLQVAEGEYRRELADSNRIRLIPRRPSRGRILDRNGYVLAANKLSHSVFLEPMLLKAEQWPAVVERLSGYTGVPAEKISQKLRAAGYVSPYPVRILQGIDPQMVTFLREHSQELPGVKVDVELLRYYPNGPVAAHLLGYTGEISEQQLALKKDQGYRLGDIVGKTGVERLIDEALHGEWGGQQVEVDAAGQVARVIGELPSKAGQDVRIALDLSLQKAAEAALGERFYGAVVAMNPRNGEVLAIASNPDFDPNVFSTGRISKTDWKNLQSVNRPLLNRAVRPYPTASTYKIIMTAAALESGKFTPATTLNTFGGLRVGNRVFREHNGRGFGRVGFVRALAMSSDTFFYQVGMRLGPDTIAEWSERFGFGRRTEIGLQSESRGLVPTPAWKQERFKQKWYPGDTANMSIGQGLVLSTPLQNALMVSAIANGGYYPQPHLIKDSLPALTPVGLSPTTLSVIRQGLAAVVTSGTAKVLRMPDIPNAGKTGSAEHGVGKGRRTHAVFVGYAPLQNPEIAVSVFLESGGHGGSNAAPIAKKIYQAYFAAKLQKHSSSKVKHVE